MMKFLKRNYLDIIFYLCWIITLFVIYPVYSFLVIIPAILFIFLISMVAYFLGDKHQFSKYICTVLLFVLMLWNNYGEFFKNLSNEVAFIETFKEIGYNLSKNWSILHLPASILCGIFIILLMVRAQLVFIKRINVLSISFWIIFTLAQYSYYCSFLGNQIWVILMLCIDSIALFTKKNWISVINIILLGCSTFLSLKACSIVFSEYQSFGTYSVIVQILIPVVFAFQIVWLIINNRKKHI